MKVYLIGAGMGGPGQLSVPAQRAIAQADLVAGSSRLVASAREAGVLDAGDVHALTRPADIVRVLREARGSVSVASVLFSGDIGFFSGAALVRRELAHEEGFEVEGIPGVSSLAYLCGKAGVSTQDVFSLSAHGRVVDVAGAVQSHERTFILTGGETRVHDACSALVERGLGGLAVWAGERLSYADERIESAPARSLAARRFGDLAVMLVENPNPVRRTFGAPGIDDDAFARFGAPITKRAVRTLAVSELEITPEAVVWDVGAGTGSVSVECALSAPRGRVIAFERDDAFAAGIRANAQAFSCSNVSVVVGHAPEAFAGAPAPDCVFIGGSGGALEGIVRAARAANPAARIVAVAVTVETIARALRVFEEEGCERVRAFCTAVTHARPVGGKGPDSPASHLMCAQNPVWIASCGGVEPAWPVAGERP